MDHVLANSERPIPEPSEEEEEVAAIEAGDEAKVRTLDLIITTFNNDALTDGLWSQSIKCSECGKVFRSSATASFHAEKSGHQEFEESTEEVSWVPSPCATFLGTVS